MNTQLKRPAGVTIIGILSIIGGILYLILSGTFIGLSLISPLISQVDVNNVTNSLEDEGISVNSTDITTAINEFSSLSQISGYIMILGIVFFPLAIVSFINAWGLLKGKGWAWIMAIILTIISIILGIIVIALLGVSEDILGWSLDIAGFVVDGVILWYLFRPNVKEYFGRVTIQNS